VSRRADLAAAGPVLRVLRLGKRYAELGPPALSDVSFEVADGELLGIVGPSGCGKTTLLRILCGLTRPTSGEVLFADGPVVRPPREVAVVFQDYSRSLFPWLSVVRNVMFPLRGAGVSRTERRTLADAALEELGLQGVARKYPWELSGGMQQRVAIARALVSRPELLLLDEPFGSVDALTRGELQDVLLRVHGDSGGRRVTIVHVTHDIDEAVYLADRVLVLSPPPGRLVSAVEVELPRPRGQIATRSSPGFLAVRNEIHSLISSHQAIRSEAT
jgi:ABC-type nitrate/sulfonate/bicarbonate transport system ATPase subunit